MDSAPHHGHAAELTRLDLRDLERRYGFPYLVIHRSDLHAVLLRACQGAGVELINNAGATSYENDSATEASVVLEDGTRHTAPVIIAAEGIHSPARYQFVGDEAVSSSYVAYRGAIPFRMEIAKWLQRSHAEAFR